MFIDILVILGLCAVLLLAALKFGKKILTPLLFATLISVPILKYFIIESSFFAISTSTSLIPYAVILALLYFAFKNHVKGGTFKGKNGTTKAAFASATLTLLLVSIYFAFLPETIYRFSAETKSFLTIYDTHTTLGIYMVAAIIAIYLIKPRND